EQGSADDGGQVEGGFLHGEYLVVCGFRLTFYFFFFFAIKGLCARQKRMVNGGFAPVQAADVPLLRFPAK
uniref:hypothetical protein n=1 Tax=uncultured Cardiobacterium sp. TaxID=417619 RepID=UPI00260BBC7F